MKLWQLFFFFRIQSLKQLFIYFFDACSMPFLILELISYAAVNLSIQRAYK